MQLIRGFEDDQRRNVGPLAEILSGDETLDENEIFMPVSYRVKYKSTQSSRIIEKEWDYWFEVKRSLKKVKHLVSIECYTLDGGWSKLTVAQAKRLDALNNSGDKV